MTVPGQHLERILSASFGQTCITRAGHIYIWDRMRLAPLLHLQQLMPEKQCLCSNPSWALTRHNKSGARPNRKSRTCPLFTDRLVLAGDRWGVRLCSGKVLPLPVSTRTRVVKGAEGGLVTAPQTPAD